MKNIIKKLDTNKVRIIGDSFDLVLDRVLYDPQIDQNRITIVHDRATIGDTNKCDDGSFIYSAIVTYKVHYWKK